VKTPKFFKWSVLSLLIIISLTAVCYLGLNVYIGIHVNKHASLARESFPNEKDQIYSMIKYMNRNDYSLNERNNMVWAIGRLSDKNALPYLQAVYTGKPCNHSLYLCQYELAKAINRCGGNVDFTYKDKKYNR
jgi:hypothetical protein